MTEKPTFTRHPIEYFGYSYTNLSKKARDTRIKQYCPYLEGECKKPRKSEPHIKIGVCTVGYKGDHLKEFSPVIICPYRFYHQEVYDIIKREYYGELPQTYEIIWIPEVSMGVGGSVDFVASKFKKIDGLRTIDDFICIEFQAAGTTGTPWDAVLEFKEHETFLKATYKFGINWANEFAKTMMQQVYKKGHIIEVWQKKIVFALQDVGMAYLKRNYDVSELHEPPRDEDSILFYTFKMSWDVQGNRWILEFDGKIGTNCEGIRRILSGSNLESYPSLEQFLKNIRRKMSNTP